MNSEEETDFERTEKTLSKRKCDSSQIATTSRPRKRKVVSERKAHPKKLKAKRTDKEKKLEAACRPYCLIEMFDSLSEKQVKDVKDIGFEGVLNCRISTKINSRLVSWLVNNFDSGSLMFNIASGKEFVVTEADVHDVFLLPWVVGSEVVESQWVRNTKNSKQKTSGQLVMENWKRKFGVTGAGSVNLRKITDAIKEEKEGGDEFKRLFVLFVVSHLLAPTSNRTACLQLVVALEDVGKIKDLNWCGYVLKKLSSAVQRFKRNHENTFVGGCLLLLQTLYFQRLVFKGVEVPKTLPLIKNWNSEKIKARVKDEIKAGDFGRGPIDSSYPISKQNICLQKQIEVLNKEEQRSRFVRYDIPEGMPTDEDINKTAKDEKSKTLMLVKRDVELVFRAHMSPTQEMDVQEQLSQNQSSQSTTSLDKIFNDPKTFEIVDAVVDWLMDMKQNTEAENIDRNIEMENVVFVTEKDASGNEEGELQTKKNDAGNEERERPTDKDGASNEEGEHSIQKDGDWNKEGEEPEATNTENNGAGKEGITEKRMTFLSQFMKQRRSTRWQSMKDFDKHLVDYCFYDDGMENEELIVRFNESLYVTKKDMMCLGSTSFIPPAIVNCWAYYLNEEELIAEQEMGKRFYFGISHAPILTKIMQEGFDNESRIALDRSWDEWLSVNNQQWNIAQANFLVIPFLHNNHYSSIFINTLSKKAQLVDYRIKEDVSLFKYLAGILCLEMSIYLKKKKHPKVKQMPKYVFEEVNFDWKLKRDSNDCGVYLLMTMFLFEGVSFKYSLNKVEDRKFHRAEICSSLTGFEKNEVINEVKKKINEFIKMKGIKEGKRAL
ncbi:unnamed protein product [Cuscuta epithymum]|uniref:Ubiquitin-like protease family profile domain-containing protein n=1 Tax=Cuscuta epithymum TaxID=186058 RepID=A0AAV0G0U9_9ASTE|nr:unnamed protein product [Cuscuta epithymum]CAH9141437.1 unnamed protein product [Cuscuta epithymum]